MRVFGDKFCLSSHESMGKVNEIPVLKSFVVRYKERSCLHDHKPGTTEIWKAQDWTACAPAVFDKKKWVAPETLSAAGLQPSISYSPQSLFLLDIHLLSMFPLYVGLLCREHFLLI